MDEEVFLRSGWGEDLRVESQSAFFGGEREVPFSVVGVVATEAVRLEDWLYVFLEIDGVGRQSAAEKQQEGNGSSPDGFHADFVLGWSRVYSGDATVGK